MATKMASNFKSAPKAAEDRPRALAEGVGNRAIDAHQVKLFAEALVALGLTKYSRKEDAPR
jgi:hypothetical protein